MSRLVKLENHNGTGFLYINPEQVVAILDHKNETQIYILSEDPFLSVEPIESVVEKINAAMPNYDFITSEIDDFKPIPEIRHLETL